MNCARQVHVSGQRRAAGALELPDRLRQARRAVGRREVALHAPRAAHLVPVGRHALHRAQHGIPVPEEAGVAAGPGAALAVHHGRVGQADEVGCGGAA